MLAFPSIGPHQSVTRLTVALRKSAKHWYRAAEKAVIRNLFSWNQSDFAEQLSATGIRTGDALLVHCSMGGLKGFGGSASDIVRCVQNLVGDRGLIVMPTQPFLGSAISYAEAGRVFDLRRTPSRMGLVSEVFRRGEGVVRSLHPTHAVAAWGSGARELVANHHLAATPCGRGSPYARLAERDGKMLFLGTGIDVMTYFHTIEEELEPLMPQCPFTGATYELSSRNERGEIVSTITRLFDRGLSRRRNLGPLHSALKRRGELVQRRIGLARVLVVRMRDVADLCRESAQQGRFFYDS